MQVILPSLPLASFQRELIDLCESFKTRYISIQVMNYYVCDNMADYENLLLRILFGFLLLSVLFCNDSHHGVLSKDFIYGCLVRNRKLDPSMGDNFKCLYLNVRYLYRREQFSRNLKLAIPISKTRGHRFITLALPHSLFSMDLPVCMDVQCNPAWSAYHLYEKPGNSGENLNGTVHPGGNVPEKRNTFRGITFFPVFTEKA